MRLLPMPWGNNAYITHTLSPNTCSFATLALFGQTLGIGNSADNNEGTYMPVSNEVKSLVQAFYSACAVFIRGSWTASGGRTIVRTLKDGTERTDKVFEIMIPSGQLNGAPEIDTVALVAKAKGEVALFVLVEQVGDGVTAQGMGYTLWTGSPLKQ